MTSNAQTEARAIAPLTLEGAIWHYMDQKAVAAYGPWITKADHDAALAAKDAELEAVRANRTDAHGWLFNNPDTGIEWLEQHPIESGEVPDAENVRPASAEEVVTLLREAWNALAAERAAREAAEAKLAEKDKEIAALREWQPIETAPFNRSVDLWCTYPDAPATWGNGLPSGVIVYGRHKTEEYGWFGNQSKDGVPTGDGPDLIPVAWREPSPRIPIEMMEAFLEARNAGGNDAE